MMSQARITEPKPPDVGVSTVGGFLDFLAENEEIRKLKWLESEKAGFDIGLAQALATWMNERRSEWLDQKHPENTEFLDARGAQRKLGVTLSLPDRGLPWPNAYMANLDAACRSAAQLGYQLVELSIPDIGPEAEAQIRRVHSEYGVGIVALATRAGWVAHGLNLVNPNPLIRERAIEYAAQTIQLAAPVEAAVIVSSWVGADYEFVDQALASDWLLEGLSILAEFAERNGVKLLFEPLSRGGAEDDRILDRGRHILEFGGVSSLSLATNQTRLNGMDSLHRVNHLRYVRRDGLSASERHLEFNTLLELLDQANFNGALIAECLPQVGHG